MLKNGLYNTIGGLLRIGLNFLIIPILNGIIGIEEFGIWILISSVIGVAGLADGGLTITTTVFISRYLGEKNYQGIRRCLTVIISLTLFLATLGSGLLFLGSDHISNLFPNLNPSQQLAIAKGLKIGSLLLWTRLGGQVLGGLEQAYQKYDLMNILITIQVVITNLGILVITYLGGRVFEIVLWQAISSSLILFAHIWINYRLTKDANLVYEWNRQTMNEITRYSAAAWLGTISGTLFNQVDRLIVGSFLGAKVVAVYAIITSICTQINGISSMPVQPIVPVISSLMYGEDLDREQLKRQVKQTLQISTIIALGIGVALVNLAPQIMYILVPNATANEIICLQIAAVIYAIYSINALGYYVLLSSNGIATCTAIWALSSITSILLLVVGTKVFGLIGAIAGNAGYILTLLMNFFGMRNLKISWHEWSRWLQLPLVWFVICIALGILIPEKLALRLILLTLEGGFIIKWLISSQKLLLHKN